MYAAVIVPSGSVSFTEPACRCRVFTTSLALLCSASLFFYEEQSLPGIPNLCKLKYEKKILSLSLSLFLWSLAAATEPSFDFLEAENSRRKKGADVRVEREFREQSGDLLLLSLRVRLSVFTRRLSPRHAAAVPEGPRTAPDILLFFLSFLLYIKSCY